MKKTLNLLILIIFMAGCGQSVEEKAAQEAKEYTERCCPTPVVNNSRTDSVAFDIPTRNYIYYCTFTGPYDDVYICKQNHDNYHNILYDALKQNVGMQTYIDAGFSFTYVIRSEKDPTVILFKDTIKFNKE